MQIGIIGSGAIGQALAGHFTRGGHEVLLANRRGAGALQGLLQRLGPRARAATRDEAAAADWLVLAVPWDQLAEATAGLPARAGRIVIDTMNPVLMPGFRLAPLDGRPSSDHVAARLPGARVVKIANTLPAELLAGEARSAAGRRVLFMSGDEAAARAEVAGVFDALGFAVVDLGPLAVGGVLQQFPGGPLAALPLLREA